jgi:hypothetical protein
MEQDFFFFGLIMEQDMQNRKPVDIFKLMAEAYPTSII